MSNGKARNTVPFNPSNRQTAPILFLSFFSRFLRFSNVMLQFSSLVRPIPVKMGVISLICFPLPSTRRRDAWTRALMRVDCQSVPEIIMGSWARIWLCIQRIASGWRQVGKTGTPYRTRECSCQSFQCLVPVQRCCMRHAVRNPSSPGLIRGRW